MAVDDVDLRERLLRALHGRGAFRATKDVLYQHGLEREWYAARHRALERIATAWLASLGLGPDADAPPGTDTPARSLGDRTPSRRPRRRLLTVVNWSAMAFRCSPATSTNASLG